jgi:hypothetical protein
MITILVFLITTHFYVFVIDKDGLFGKYKSKYNDKMQKDIYREYGQIKASYGQVNEIKSDSGPKIIIGEARYYNSTLIPSEKIHYKNFVDNLKKCEEMDKKFTLQNDNFQTVKQEFKGITFALPKLLTNTSSWILILTIFALGFTGEQEFRIVKFLIGFIPHHYIIIEFFSIISCIIVIIEILLFKNAIKKLQKHYTLQKNNLKDYEDAYTNLLDESKKLRTGQLELEKIMQGSN